MAEGSPSKLKWEHVAIAVLGGAALLTGGMLLAQWRSASVGRQVSGEVLTFLQKHGSNVKGKQITGGFVTVPMQVDTAVVNTVNSILDDLNKRISRTPPPRNLPPPPPGDHDMSLPPPPPPPSSMAPRPSAASLPAVHRASVPSSPSGGGGGPREFPEPPISGKTGRPVAREAGEMTMSGEMVGPDGPGAEGMLGGGDDGDYSYKPIMPPGMVPPGSHPM